MSNGSLNTINKVEITTENNQITVVSDSATKIFPSPLANNNVKLTAQTNNLIINANGVQNIVAVPEQSVKIIQVNIPPKNLTDGCNIVTIPQPVNKLLQVTAQGPQGSQGIQGIQGPQGPPGASVANIGGSDTSIQFNSGSAFSGSNNFTYDYTNNKVSLTGSLIISTTSSVPSDLFLIKSGSTPYLDINTNSNITLYSNLFIVKNFTTQQPVLTISQSVVQFATQSTTPTGTTQAGSIWFTSSSLYVGLEDN